MNMIERTPHLGDEIQLFELAPEEIEHYNRKDQRARRLAIFKWWANAILDLIL